MQPLPFNCQGMNADEFTREFNEMLEIRHLTDKIISELRAEKQIIQRLDIGTLEYIISLAGEQGMTLNLLRAKLFSYVFTKRNQNG